MREAPGEAEKVALAAGKPGVMVPVVVRPRGRANAVSGVRGAALVVSVTAAPVDGAANAAVVAVLAECLKLPRGAVTIVRGHKSRQKTVALAGVSAEEVRARLSEIL